jgi:hypothetical protein
MRLLKTLAAGLAASWLLAMPAHAQAPAPAPVTQPKVAPAAPPKAAPSMQTTPPAAQPSAQATPPAAQPSATPPPTTPGVAPAPAPGQASPPAAGQTATPPATNQVAGPPLTAPPAMAPAAPTMDGQTYAVRLRDLEQRIDELKEQIRRSHTRLSLLSDTILSGGGAGSRANIKYTNELSSAFNVTRLLIVLDGAVQYNKTDQTGAIAQQGEIPIFNGSIPPGDHTLQVLVNLQGNGYGVFSYLRGYRFEVRSNHSFTALEGKTITLQVVSYEKGGVTTPLQERPAVRYSEKITAGLADSSIAAPLAVPGGNGK